jgi:hypothetical protein
MMNFDNNFFIRAYPNFRRNDPNKNKEICLSTNKLSSKEFFIKKFPNFNIAEYRRSNRRIRFVNEERVMATYYDNFNPDIIVKPKLIVKPYFLDKFADKKISNNGVRFNIIIRTCMRPIYFKECLLSVLNQDYGNYRIIVVYDDIKTYNTYLNGNPLLKNQTVMKVNKNNLDRGYNLYFNEAYTKVEQNCWIMHLDDDNMFVKPDVLSNLSRIIVNDKANINSMYIWKHNIIHRTLPIRNKTGSGLDTNMFTFNSRYKGIARWSSTDTADNELIKHLSNTLTVKWLNDLFTSVNTYENNVVSRNYGQQRDKYVFKTFNVDRLDFTFNFSVYPGSTKRFANNVSRFAVYWKKKAYNEGWLTRIKSLDYNRLNNFLRSNYLGSNVEKKLTIITSLYNPGSEARSNEFKMVINLNCDNKLIKKIIVFYEKKSDNDNLYNFLKSKDKVQVIDDNGRLDFIKAMKYSNNNLKGEKILLCNSDVFITDTFEKIASKALDNNVICLTRWDVIDENTIEVRNRNNQIFDTSQDCWIYDSPINIKDTKPIYMGTWNCDNEMNKLFRDSGYRVFNPCRELISIYIHNEHGRTYSLEQGVPFISPVKLNYLCEMGL